LLLRFFVHDFEQFVHVEGADDFLSLALIVGVKDDIRFFRTIDAFATARQQIKHVQFEITRMQVAAANIDLAAAEQLVARA